MIQISRTKNHNPDARLNPGHGAVLDRMLSTFKN
jgi:hypothetical protein